MKQLLIDSYKLISPYVHNTPIMESRHIENFLGNDLYFKCENFQKAGSFKIRGAFNAILKLTPEQRQKGVITHSSGNFAQALALAARTLGVKCYIVMPDNAPVVKRNAVLRYGGEIRQCVASIESRERICNQVIEQTGAVFIHASNQMDVIIGQASVTMELLESQPDLDAIIVPVGGGGLLASSILTRDYLGKEKVKIYGGEPLEADDAYRSLQMGSIQGNLTTDTMADGLCTTLGDLTFPIIQKGVEQIIRVRENEIISAMRLIWERMKIVVEPSSAIALSVLIKEKSFFKDKKVGIILTGGNVDLDNLPFENQ
ncbi:threonine ammonia-lyase [Myroides sp. LJL119]